MDALEQIKKWRQELHQIPEPGLHEYKTSKYLKTELLKMGYQPIAVLTRSNMTTFSNFNTTT